MVIIDGCTRTCGLLGNPVEHTLSPAIHNRLAGMTGMNLAYLPFLVHQGGLEDAVRGAYALNILGLNVTVPYKSEVIPFLAELDPLAESIGAVNTLVRTEGGYKGYNTDALGLYRSMCEDGVKVEGEQVLILGAGGVARAAAMMLSEKGAEKIFLLNRTEEKARQVADEVNRVAGHSVAKGLSIQEYEKLPEGKKFLAVQATSVGMYPGVENVVTREEGIYDRIHTGYDLIYTPSETVFMKLVREHGGRSFNGEKMLLYQAVTAYELWTGERIGKAQANEIYRSVYG